MNKILETTKFVVDNSEFVKINHDRVTDFSNDFEHGSAKHWLSAAPLNFKDFDEENQLSFLFIFNALSFSYWGEPKWTIEYDGKKYDGAWGMIVALGRAIKQGIPLLDFNYALKISKTDFSNILKGNTEIPLLEERWKILQELGIIIHNEFGGKVSNFLKNANNDALVLLEKFLKTFSSLRDQSFYKGKDIYFNKRAQLLVADIYQTFGGKNFGALQNIDQLTACADYKPPQILRKFRILEYTSSLAKKVDDKVELAHGSVEEVEIRANTIWAVEFIKEEIKKRNPQIMSCEINDHLWLATQEKFPDDKPYHRTRTTAY